MCSGRVRLAKCVCAFCVAGRWYTGRGRLAHCGCASMENFDFLRSRTMVVLTDEMTLELQYNGKGSTQSYRSRGLYVGEHPTIPHNTQYKGQLVAYINRKKVSNDVRRDSTEETQTLLHTTQIPQTRRQYAIKRTGMHGQTRVGERRSHISRGPVRKSIT